MSTIVISFQSNFEDTSKVTIQMPSALAEHEHIWVWDHFFSFVLYKLAETEEAEKLLNVMVEWAGAFASKMYATINELHADNAFTIDEKLKIIPVADDMDEIYAIETTEIPGLL